MHLSILSSRNTIKVSSVFIKSHKGSGIQKLKSWGLIDTDSMEIPWAYFDSFKIWEVGKKRK
jgi:hypothetical protein